MTSRTGTFTSVALQRTYGEVRRQALKHPVKVTHRGVDDLVLLSSESFAELERLAEIARRLPTALRVDELAPGELEAMLEGSRVPADYAALDDDFVLGEHDRAVASRGEESDDPDGSARTDAA